MIFVNESFYIGLGRGSKSPIGDVGSLLWRRRLATLAAKELKYELIDSHIILVSNSV